MYFNISAEMARRAMNTRELACQIGISERTMQMKLKGQREFKLSEIRKIEKVLDGSFEYLFAQSNQSHITERSTPCSK